MFKEKILKRVPIGAWEVKLESMIDRSKTDQPTDRPTDQPTNRKGTDRDITIQFYSLFYLSLSNTSS